MKPHRVCLLFTLALGTGCATIPPTGQPLARGIGLTSDALKEQIAFDHGCPAERTIVLRKDASGTNVDLDVCGQVRRYRVFQIEPGSYGGAHWMDVTGQFPASALPALPGR